MSFLSIPYEIKNGVEVPNCATENLFIDLTDYPLCNEKYFILRIVDVSTIGGSIVTSFQYNDEVYGVTSLSTDDLITLLSTAFGCPVDEGCAGQNASFSWVLTPIIYDKYLSLNIVNEVQLVQPDFIYKITDLTINATTYGALPYIIWDDNTAPTNASETVADYIDAIIAYIVSLSIPEYKGAVNKARNGMSANGYGDDLLELYFTVGTTVSITIDEATLPLAGTFPFDSAVTGILELVITDTSTVDAGDIITQTTFQVSDGTDIVGSLNLGVGTMYPYSLFINNSLDTDKGWILNITIATENECGRDNLATAVIQSADIIDAINNQVSKNGNSIA